MARYRKLLAALIGAAGVAVSQGLVHDPADKWLAVVIAFLTAIGVYQAKNE